MKLLSKELRANESEVIINIALTYCGRSPAPKGAADCVICPFLEGCNTIKKAKAVYKNIMAYERGEK